MGYALFIAALLGALLMLPVSRAAAAGAAEALELFGRVAAPSLFPFLVFSNLMRKSGALDGIGRKGRLPAALMTSFAAAVCGTPSAALICRELYASGAYGRRRASLLCAAATQAGPMFVAASLAEGMAGAPGLAAPFAVSHYAPALIFSAAAGLVRLPDRGMKPARQKTAAPKRGVFLDAVNDAVTGILRIGGLLVFFRVMYAAAEDLGVLSPLPPIARFALCGVFEMTGGLSLLANHGGCTALALCAAVLSFGGICVFAQSKLMFPELEAMPYFAVKAVLAAAGYGVFMLVYRSAGGSAEASFSLSEALEGAGARGAALGGAAISFGGSLAVSLLLSSMAVKKGTA